MSDPLQVGRTTRQMTEAPRGAMYVWPNAQLAYPRSLAGRLGRRDLLIVTEPYLDESVFRGMSSREIPAVVLDHAVGVARINRPVGELLHALEMRGIRVLRYGDTNRKAT